MHEGRRSPFVRLNRSAAALNFSTHAMTSTSAVRCSKPSRKDSTRPGNGRVGMVKIMCEGSLRYFFAAGEANEFSSHSPAIHGPMRVRYSRMCCLALSMCLLRCGEGTHAAAEECYTGRSADES